MRRELVNFPGPFWMVWHLYCVARAIQMTPSLLGVFNVHKFTFRIWRGVSTGCRAADGIIKALFCIAFCELVKFGEVNRGVLPEFGSYPGLGVPVDVYSSELVNFVLGGMFTNSREVHSIIQEGG